MAVRPVFVVSLDNNYCIRENIELEFFNGFSEKQKRRCIGKTFYAVYCAETDFKKEHFEWTLYEYGFLSVRILVLHL